MTLMQAFWLSWLGKFYQKQERQLPVNSVKVGNQVNPEPTDVMANVQSGASKPFAINKSETMAGSSQHDKQSNSKGCCLII